LSLKSFAFYDLNDAFGQSGCAVCRLLKRDVARLLDSILYEYATDRGMQARFRASRGLCGKHGWELSRNNNALGIAILYEQSLHELLTILDKPAPVDKARRGIGRLFTASTGHVLADSLEPARQCLACETQTVNEANYIRALAEDLGDDAMLSAFKSSDGLCVEHFRQALRATTDPARAAHLTNVQRDIWTRLRADLLEFMRKSDYNHADEAMGPEADSWLRAIARLSGEIHK
jgi:hypothetical protein